MKLGSSVKKSPFLFGVLPVMLVLAACGSSSDAEEAEAEAPLTVESILSSLQCEDPSPFSLGSDAQGTGFQCADWFNGGTEVYVYDNSAALEVALTDFPIRADKKTVVGPVWILLTFDGDVAINAVQQGGRSVG